MVSDQRQLLINKYVNHSDQQTISQSSRWFMRELINKCVTGSSFERSVSQFLLSIAWSIPSFICHLMEILVNKQHVYHWS